MSKRSPRLVVLQSGEWFPMSRGWKHPDSHNLYHPGTPMKMTRKQKRAENKRRHRALRKMKVTTYDDLIARDRNPRRKLSARARYIKRMAATSSHSTKEWGDYWDRNMKAEKAAARRMGQSSSRWRPGSW